MEIKFNDIELHNLFLAAIEETYSEVYKDLEGDGEALSDLSKVYYNLLKNFSHRVRYDSKLNSRPEYQYFKSYNSDIYRVGLSQLPRSNIAVDTAKETITKEALKKIERKETHLAEEGLGEEILKYKECLKTTDEKLKSFSLLIDKSKCDNSSREMTEEIKELYADIFSSISI